MRGMMVALLLLLGFATPAAADTSSTGLIYRDLPRICIHTVKTQPGQNVRAPRCIGGLVNSVSSLGLKLGLSRGPAVRVLFTNRTRFVTESAAASLIGLTQGDFACVEGVLKARVLNAAVVLFDPDPFSCGPPRKQVRKLHKTAFPTAAAAT